MNKNDRNSLIKKLDALKKQTYHLHINIHKLQLELIRAANDSEEKGEYYVCMQCGAKMPANTRSERYAFIYHKHKKIN